MSDLIKCAGLTCAVRDSCTRYSTGWLPEESWAAFYATESFRPADGCEYYRPSPGIKGRIQADFDKARE